MKKFFVFVSGLFLFLLVFFTIKNIVFASTLQQVNWNSLNYLKLFGQSDITQTTRNTPSGYGVYHGAGVFVDTSSTPNKVYVADTGNNRFLGYNGMGYCSNNHSQGCMVDIECGNGNTCTVNGTKKADIVFGQPDLFHTACNGDSNIGIYGTASASMLCLLSYPSYTNNTAESWFRTNFQTDTEGNLWIVDRGNNRILEYYQPFSADKTNGKGDNIADFEIGQPDFTSTYANGALVTGISNAPVIAPPTNKTLDLMTNDIDAGTSDSVSVDGSGNVWVADTYNSRVLRYPSASQSANLVLGQINFTTRGSTCGYANPTQNLNKFCGPTIAKIRPDTGDLYVVDEYKSGYTARILVFHPPFSNQMSAYKSITVTNASYDGTGNYAFTYVSSLLFNPDLTDYPNVTMFVADAANRLLLIDDNGTPLGVIGAKDINSRGGDVAYPGACSMNIYDPTKFYAWWTGGSIGVDAYNNIYLDSEHFFGRISRYALPYTLHDSADHSQMCQPVPNGGLFPGLGANLRLEDLQNLLLQDIIAADDIDTSKNLGESADSGLAIFQNQLLAADENGLLKVWNNYTVKANGDPPDYIVQNPAYLFGYLSDAIDSSNRLWTYNNYGAISVYQLPITQNYQAPLATNVKLYWSDNPNTLVNLGGTIFKFVFDKASQNLFLVQENNNRILRIPPAQYNNFASGKVLVDMVIGQPSEASTSCSSPSANTLCSPHVAKFDNSGNLYVVENDYECHGNDRIVFYPASAVQSAMGMISNLTATKVFIAPDLNTKGPCGYVTTGEPGSPIDIAFTNANQMVVSNDGYYGERVVRSQRQLWFYNDPINKQTPDAFIPLSLGTPSEMIIDDAQNLYIRDGTWYRILGISPVLDESVWMQSLSSTKYTFGLPTPTLTPIPTETLTPTPTPTPTNTPTPLPPQIDSLSPNSGSIGATINITGQQFGTFIEGVSKVLFQDIPATITSWADTIIRAIVPDGATTGKVTVMNNNGIATSSGNFAIDTPTPIPTETPTPTPVPTDTPIPTQTPTPIPTSTPIPTPTSSPIFNNLPDSTANIDIIEGQLITTNPYIIEVKPTSNNGISKVEFYIDDNLICTTTSPDATGVYSCSWDTSKYHSIVKVIAYDNSNSNTTLNLDTTVSLNNSIQSSNSSSSNGGGNSSNSNSSWTCTDQPPGSAPDLYEVDTTGTTATIYFAPAAQPYTEYFVSFGDGVNSEGYGTGFSLSQTSGALKYDVYHLKSGAVYTFKVRAGNGCMAGPWSGNLTVKTGGSSKSIAKFYPKQQATFSIFASNAFTGLSSTIKKAIQKIIPVTNTNSTNPPPQTAKTQPIAPQQPKQIPQQQSLPKPKASSKTCFLFVCW